MKRFFLLVILVFSMITTFAENPKQIKSFTDLMDYLKKGADVNVVLYYEKCQLISDNEIVEKVPQAIGGMKLDVWEYFAPQSVHNEKAFLVSSTSKLIQYPKGDGYVYNYVKIKLYDDNTVKITAQYIDSVTYKILMDESFYGIINDGDNDEGVCLFIK